MTLNDNWTCKFQISQPRLQYNFIFCTAGLKKYSSWWEINANQWENCNHKRLLTINSQIESLWKLLRTGNLLHCAHAIFGTIRGKLYEWNFDFPMANQISSEYQFYPFTFCSILSFARIKLRLIKFGPVIYMVQISSKQISPEPNLKSCVK